MGIKEDKLLVNFEFFSIALINPTHFPANQQSKKGMKSKIKDVNTKIRKYQKTGTYKGFHLKGEERHYKLSGITHLTFTNGEKELFASGIFSEEAYQKMFDIIDRYTKNS